MGEQLRPVLERKLRANIEGDVLFDRASRGRYATDASHYQQMPTGVVVPKTMAAASAALEIAREEGVPITARGGGTSQCGQAINSGLIIDCSRYLTKVLELDVAGMRARVQPGIVLDELNRQLRQHGLWFPVDVSTASRCTIGGMAANNSCGGRSLRYGTMRDNVISIQAQLPDGTQAHFGKTAPDLGNLPENSPIRRLAGDLFAIGASEAEEINLRFPKVQRRVGGYNLDALTPGSVRNLSHILVGSEGTLGFSTEIEIKLWPLLGKRTVGACHFGSFYEAMDAAQHLVKLGPIAIELVDETLLTLANDLPIFQATLKEFVRGRPSAVLLVEFAEADDENSRRMSALHEMMGDLGFGWDKQGRKWGGVVEINNPALQAAVAGLRVAGLNIMMSMKEEGKPISFIEDCAVPLEHLADYTEKLTAIFARQGTRGTWYAHASEGCLHVRPVLNLRQDVDVRSMRTIAEEAFALVREYKGSHSGEHGDGIVRSEFHESMFGSRLVGAFEKVKDLFDPKALFNPGKIVRAPKFDDKTLFRYGPDYKPVEIRTELDWSAYTGKGNGLQGAAEMCNNNGACRNLAGGVMCPSYRVTRDEKDATRGRANMLRLAISGQLGPEAFSSDEMAESLKLCVSCKGCRRECPTGVDMARFKIEFLAARARKHGHSLRDRLVGWMPRYAPFVARVGWIANLRNRSRLLARLAEPLTGMSAERPLPHWQRKPFADSPDAYGPEKGSPVVLFVDTFNRYFERENIDAALQVLTAAGYRVHIASPKSGAKRPLCCGRTFLSVGRVDKAREEIGRVLDALGEFIRQDVPIVGLEPSCILSFRDEVPSFMKHPLTEKLAKNSFLFEEFLDREATAGTLNLPLSPIGGKVLLHGHCHQKSFGVMSTVERTLRLIPDLELETVETSCCGMAGAFGYAVETAAVSREMGELSLLPAIRKASGATIVIADGTSCRHQIKEGAQRDAIHVSRALARSLAANPGSAVTDR